MSVTDKDVLPGNTRCLDTLANLFLVVVDGCGIDMTVSGFQGQFNSVFDFIWLRLLRTLLALSIPPHF